MPLAWERVTDVWSALLDNPDACADDRTVRPSAALTYGGGGGVGGRVVLLWEGGILS